MSDPPPAFFPLLSLPRDQLEAVVAKAEDKAQLRIICAQLRGMVDSATTSLSRCNANVHKVVPWPDDRAAQLLRIRAVTESLVGKKDLVFTSQLFMRLPRLTSVDISNCSIADLVPLATCASLHTLNCTGTEINSLAPLASCTALHTMDCSFTAVSSLAPLASCTSLRTLNCSVTQIISLAPLASCTALHTLNCFGTAVSSLAPLASCTALHTLNCFGTAVSSLAPLAPCTALKELVCDRSLDRKFVFLKNVKVSILKL